MPIAGMQVQNITNHINLVRKFVAKKRKQMVPSGFVDNRVLKLHYKYMFYVLIFIYLSIWQSWYQKDVMTCVNKFNADSQIRQDFLNICFTFVYIPLADGTRRYLFFYRYLHFVIIFLGGLYYLIHKYIKHFDDLRSKRLLNEIEPSSPKATENDIDNKIYHKVPQYILNTKGTNDGLYWKNLGACILALMLDLVSFRVLDFCLHDRFLEYGYLTLPFNRDPQYYTDYMSQTFPPFAECTISPMHELIAKREDVFGCHLTVMELYEKLFFALWVWLAVLVIITTIYILHLFCFLFPYYRMKIQRSYKVPEFAEADAEEYMRKIDTSLKSFSIGDTFLLWRLQKTLTQSRYFVVLCKVAMALDPVGVEFKGKNRPEIEMQDDIDDDHHHPQAYAPPRQQKRVPFPPGGGGMGPPMGGGGGGNLGWKLNALRGEGQIPR